MGCKESKYQRIHPNNRTILKLCKDRKHFIKSASDFRYALASAHAAYFNHLILVGQSLSRFVEEDDFSSSSLSSPLLTVTSLTITHNNDNDIDNDNDALPGTSSFNSVNQRNNNVNSASGYLNYGINYGYDDDYPVYNYSSYYMNQSASRISSVVLQEREYNVNNRIYSFNDEENYGYRPDELQQKAREVAPLPQSPPKVAAWDYFNLFENGGAYEYEYGNEYKYENESSLSSLDSREVREREGIPDLEEDTQKEFSFPSSSSKNNVHFPDYIHRVPGNNNTKNNNVNSASSISSISGGGGGAGFYEEGSRWGNVVESKTELESVDEEGKVAREEEHCIPSSVSTLSGHGTRDLRDVVREISDEFEAAAYYGIEVSTLLEVGREPYRSSRSTFAKDILTKVCSASLTSTYSPSDPATLYPVKEVYTHSLASTLDKLYAWEKKLYRTVKDELVLRLMCEKQCKRLKTLEEQGAESGKVEATQRLVKELFIKINVSVRTVYSISVRIHKLRDEELQPQLKELLNGLKKMWKLMLKCHQKQFQAIVESKTRVLKANTGLKRYSSVQATIQLEAVLLKWCQHFNNWVDMQRSYVQALNGWLERCIQYEPKVTPNGAIPFSPGQIGAPPVFVMCHDWKKAMERVSELKVQTSMNDFATCLHQLSERQDEEQRQRIKTNDIYRDFEKQNRVFSGLRHDDVFSDENSILLAASDTGMTTLDDLKVDLVSMRRRARQERRCHKEAVKLVHEAVSRSIQTGMIPVFESLESFTSEASKALDSIRLHT